MINIDLKYGKFIGCKFNELTIIKIYQEYKISAKRNMTMCECSCACGNFSKTLLHRVLNKKTKSCGICLNLKHLNNHRGAARKYTSKEAAARDVWNNFYKKSSNLTFDNFLKISQKNCHYCNEAPKNKATSRNSEYNLGGNKDIFIYNGLDRIDSNVKHNIDNVVPCCKYCNRAKLKLPINEFYRKIKNIYTNSNLEKLKL